MVYAPRRSNYPSITEYPIQSNQGYIEEEGRDKATKGYNERYNGLISTALIYNILFKINTLYT